MALGKFKEALKDLRVVSFSWETMDYYNSIIL
jgi:hypothetical protein